MTEFDSIFETLDLQAWVEGDPSSEDISTLKSSVAKTIFHIATTETPEGTMTSQYAVNLRDASRTQILTVSKFIDMSSTETEFTLHFPTKLK